MPIDPNFRRGGGLGRGLEALFEDSRIDGPVARKKVIIRQKELNI